MSRFRPAVEPQGPMDDDVRALMADIDASLADLEKHLDASRKQDRAADAQSTAPAAPAEVVSVPAPPESVPELEVTPSANDFDAPAVETGGLLAELEQETRAASGEGSSAAEIEATQAKQLHEALWRIFRFMNSLSRYANALAPTIDRVYRLDAQTAYTELKWRDAATRSRQQSLSEKALLDYVVFRVSLQAPAPLTVTRRWDQIEALQKELHILDLRQAEDDLSDKSPVPQGLVRLRLSADFPVQITFRANYRRNRIDVLSRNLEGFGIAAFTCDAADITQHMLDDFGRYLLARIGKLPAALNRVHCRAAL